MRNERIVKREMSVRINTEFGEFEVIAYKQITTGDTHLAIKKGYWNPDEPVLVRVHSSSETGDVIGSLFQGYGVQLQKAMEKIAANGKGLLLYMRHDEKTDDIIKRLKSFESEQTEPATSQEAAQRDFGVGAQILRDLGISKLRLITNSPKRRVGLIGYGLEIVENVEL